jgi:hypothetical protein
MKTLILLLTLTYCDGFNEGYCEGWRDVKGQTALCPLTPPCPISPLDCRSYRCGYNFGFKKGRESAR